MGDVRPDRSERGGQRGLVLVGVLWILMLLSLAVLPVMTIGHESAEIAHNATQRSQARAVAEAGINLALLDLLEPLPDEVVPLDGSVHVLRFAGTDIRVAIEDENGKIDLNTAGPDLLARLFRAAGAETTDAQKYADAIADWRNAAELGSQVGQALPEALRYSLRRYPFASVDALYRVPGVPTALIAKVKAVLTVFSSSSSVDLRSAPPLVRAALSIDSDESQATEETEVPQPLSLRRDMAGRALTIRASVRLAGGAAFEREAVVRLTGAPEEPFWILSWHEASDDRPEEAAH